VWRSCSRPRAAIALAAIGTLSLAAAAHGAPTRLVDVFGQSNVQFREAGEANFGYAARGLGDVNGDGLDDLSFSTGSGRMVSGNSIVVPGRRFPREVNLARHPSGSFVVTSPLPGEYLRPAGDVNGDGLTDMLVGDGESVFVVFGSAVPRDVATAQLGSAGFQIVVPESPNPRNPVDFDGVKYTAAGDVNGDGRDDVLVTVLYVNGAGSAAVVFGSDSTERVDLSALGERGFRIERLCNAVLLGDPDDSESTDIALLFTAAGIGDLNSDGVDEVAIGSPRSATVRCRAPRRSELLIVYGGHSLGTVDGGAPGDRGVLMTGRPGAFEYVVGPGDVNGDGRDDLAFDARRGINVAFGPRPPTRLEHVGPGYTIRPARRNRSTPLGAPGDLNGDGGADLIVGNHVVFGLRRPRPLALDALGSAGYRVLQSDSANDEVFGPPDDPGVLAPAGDVGGDSRPDLVVAAPSLGPARAHVLLSGGPPLVEVAPRRRSSVLSAGGRVRLRVLCPANASGPCVGRLRLVLRGRTLFSARFRAPAGRAALVEGKVRRAVLPVPPLSMHVEAIASSRDRQGRRAVTRRTIVLRSRSH
jgi:hypothetical protein